MVFGWNSSQSNDEEKLLDPELDSDLKTYHGCKEDTEMTFYWNNINVKTKKKVELSCGTSWMNKPLVKDATGVVRPGELLAIMGASGAGKSTLMNALTFRNLNGLNVTGERFINNNLVTPDCLTKLSGYVQQDDLFIGTLTVREHLIFQALLRMDRSLTYIQKIKRVNEVIEELGLKKAIDTLIGVPGRIKGISGGEMKRLALASELLNNPSLLFCDEPTSGLDSFMAFNVVECLKKISNDGKTVVFTVHQPSSQIFSMFDKILLMAEGRIAYHGDACEVSQFLSDIGHPCPPLFNPADHVVTVLAVAPGEEEKCRKSIDGICQKYQNSQQVRELKMKLKSMNPKMDGKRSPYNASWNAQFRALLWRSWLSHIREPSLMKARIVQTVILAAIISLLFYNQGLNQAGVKNINGALFFLVLNASYATYNVVIKTFCLELPLFLREHFDGIYRTDVYFITKQLAELPGFLFVPFLTMSIVYYIIGFNPNINRFFTSIGILQLITQVALSFTYLISCISNTLAIAINLGGPLLLIIVLFGGIFLQQGTGWLNWLNYFSWILYGNEALLINQWSGIEWIECEDGNATVCVKSGKDVLVHAHFREDNFWNDILMLGASFVIFRVLAYLALLRKTIRKEK